jgi:hypothetical protein
MKLHDPNFLTFAGEPITGRSPPQLLVRGNDGQLTPAQYAGVTQAYRQFKTAVNVSPAPYSVRNRVLADGTTIRLESNQGNDRVFVSPPPVLAQPPQQGGLELLQDVFKAVPSSVLHRNGYTPPGDPGPSAQWLGYRKNAPPPALEHVAALVSHPGHVSWASDSFKDKDGFRVQLSWRGPDDRYSHSSGWSAATGGSFVAHEDHAYAIGSRSVLYQDSGDLWINGRWVDTQVNKIIAAALHRPDPEGAPSNVVLRVCTDNYPQPSSTRGFAVYDLVPDGAAIGDSTLAGLLKASAFDIAATHVAANFKGNLTAADTGKWNFRQRPHFDQNGARLATSAVVPEPLAQFGLSYLGLVLGLPDLEILETIGYDFSDVSSENGSYGMTPSPPTYVAEASATGQRDVEESNLLAIDFLGEEVVHLRRRRVYARTSEYESGATWGGFNPSSGTESHSETVGISVIHSAHGVLVDYSYAFDTDSSWGDGDIGLSVGDEANELVSFVGDLSRDMFAIGWSSATDLHAASGTVPGENSGTAAGPTGSGISRARSNPLLKYDVYVRGVKVGDQVEGTRVSTAAAEGSTVNYSAGVRVAAGLVFSDHTTTSLSLSTPISSREYQLASPPVYPQVRYMHAAVEPRKKVGYLGVCHNHVGMNVVVRDLAPGSPGEAVESFPDYAPGDLPTLAAPIFLEHVPL